MFEQDYFLLEKMFKKASKGYKGAPFCKGIEGLGGKMARRRPISGRHSKRRSKFRPIAGNLGPLMRFDVDLYTSKYNAAVWARPLTWKDVCKCTDQIFFYYEVPLPLVFSNETS